MSDQPVTLAVFQEFQHKVFEEFQRKVFEQFVAGADRFDRFEARVDARFDEVTGQIDALSQRLLRLEWSEPS